MVRVRAACSVEQVERMSESQIGSGMPRGVRPAAEPGPDGVVAQTPTEPAEATALAGELVDLVRGISAAQSDEVEIISVLVGALDALTTAYEALYEQMLQLGARPPSLDRASGDSTVTQAGSATASQRGLRQQARQARHRAEIVRGRAQSLAARAAELQEESARLSAARSRGDRSRAHGG
jgi:hypothetical protein